MTPDRLFEGLLQLELLQRSMLVEGHIMDNVEAAAGFSLTDTSPVLSAASSAMAGRIAEKLAERDQSDDRPTYDPNAIKRAKQDLRFYAILSKDPEYWIIAEGYFCRAASFQPDVPVHWKKAWDCLAVRKGTSIHSHAVPYVTELLRIAAMKNNAKRIETLTLQLVDCYLQDDTAHEATKSIATKAYLPRSSKSVSLAERVDIAKSLISKVNATDESMPYALSLKLRIEMMQSFDDPTKDNSSLISIGERLWKHGALEYSEVLMCYTDHLLKTAKETTHWKDAAHFATMVVETNNDSNDGAMVTHVCLTIPIIEWQQTESFLSDTLRATQDALRRSLSTAEVAAAKSMEKRSTKLKEMQCAIAAIECWLVLRGETAGTRYPFSPMCDYATDCGVAYLEFLVAWSGFHRIPWQQVLQSEARSVLQSARSSVSTLSQNLLLQLGEADTEGTAFDGGRIEVARKLYESTLQAAKVEIENGDTSVLTQLVSARCLIGLAETNECEDSRLILATESVQESLRSIEAIDVNDEATLHVWTTPGYLKSCLAFLTARGRQISANNLLRRGKPIEAELILENAVLSAPGDPSANLGLGSFRLYKALYVEDSTPDALKEAQVQLLKAAKLDSSQADPFALLGFWYEHNDDLKRAAGCYSKALLSNPAHPVAGRGLIRLAPSEALVSTFDAAVRTQSTTSGWAWRMIGKKKAMEDGDDELAVIALLKALRCQDIARSKSDLKSPFYKDPKSISSAVHPEQAETLWDLAQCYRRLGRFSASVRTFNSAIEIAGELTKPGLLCDCAQGM